MAGPSSAITLPSDLHAHVTVALAAVANRISERIDRGVELMNAPADGPSAFNTFRANRSKWDDTNRDLLRRLFKTDAPRLLYEKTGQVPPGGSNPKVELEHLRGSVSHRLSLLQTILDRLSSHQDEAGHGGGDAVATRATGGGTRVLILHAGETSTAHSIARYFESLRMKPTIVSGKPADDEIPLYQMNAYNDAGFAVVLLSASDASSAAAPAIQPETLVWLGYLAGWLGASRVCGLAPAGLPAPRDRLDIKTIEYDQHGAWKTLLARRVQAAGVEIDPAHLA